MTSSDWDPDLYERFKAQRGRPFHDLAALVVRDRPVDRLVDLGCGTGELTADLARDLGAGSAVGVDSSPAMLERAAAFAGDGLRFERGDLARWTSAADHDLVFANASLHWVPDHGGVLERWTRALRPGGQLAVQVPANGDHPAYVIAAEVAGSDPFASAFDGDLPPDPSTHNVLPPEDYASLLYDLGFVEQAVRLTVYDHVLPSTTHVVEWIRGTNLTRFLAVLPSDAHEEYVEAVRRAVLGELGDRRPFFFPFKRILMWGRRPR